MTPQRWQQLEEIFDAAIELPPEERPEFLERSCGDDGELRSRIERLLHADVAGGNFLEDAISGSLEIWDEEQTEAKLDRRIGPYRLMERIGFGGMGEVYLAERADREYDQQVAIKLIHPGLNNERILERFRRERQILARFEHPNIARLLDGGTTENGRPYFVMEYIEGVPIDRDCDRRQLDLEQRLRLFSDVCAAVRYAHQHLVVHRDLKPSNILVTADGTVKLLDFGIAKLLSPEDSQLDLTSTAEQPLTLNYASPEQVRGEPVNTASDVYTLGVVLFELLTGQRPFDLQGLNRREAERVICEIAAPLPSTVSAESDAPPRAQARQLSPEHLARRLRGDLDTIVLTAVHKDPARRYSSPEALADDLKRHLDGLPVLAHRDSFAYRASKFIRRNRIKLSVACAFLILITFSLVSRSLQARRIAQEHQRAMLTLEFLEELFNASDPRHARGQNVTSLELLDRGAMRLENLSTEPLVQARLHDTIGHVYFTLGQYEAADEHLAAALRLRRRLLPKLHPDLARTLNRVAALKRVTSDFEQAERLHREATSILQQGPERQEWLAEGLNDLGLTLREQNRLKEAEPLFREASNLLFELFGEQHPGYLTTLNNLALVQLDLQEFEEAERSFRKLNELAPKVYGQAPHPEIAQILNNLGKALGNQGRLEEAETLHRQALDMRRQLFAEQPQHPDVIASLNNLGTIRFFLGDFDSSEAFFREATEYASGPRGLAQTGLATSLNNLAEVLKVKGDFEQARGYFRQALDIRRNVLGEEHPDALVALNNLAALLITMGEYQTADENYEQLIQLHERAKSPPAERALSLSNLALSKRYRERYEEAQQLYLEARQLFVEAFDEEHPEVARMTSGLAAVRVYQGALAEAEQLYRQALELQRRRLGDEHPRVATTLTGLGDVLTRLGQLEESQSVLENALAIRRQALPPDHWQIAETGSLLGACLQARGQTDEARPLLREGYERISEQRGAEHPMAREALARWQRFPR